MVKITTARTLIEPCPLAHVGVCIFWLVESDIKWNVAIVCVPLYTASKTVGGH